MLVERIIHKLIVQKIDIDQLLVVTFTNAAASEMRQRILEAIYQKLEETPEDEHLQKQTVLMEKSNICTIHSFCLEVIRNHFYELGIAPNMKVAEQTEIELLKQEVLEDIFEQKYEKEDASFLQLINTYTNYRGDEPLKELILRIYRYIQSHPFPEKWLEEAVQEFQIQENREQNFANTKWGAILIQAFCEEIEGCIMELESLYNSLAKIVELEKYSRMLEQDKRQLELLLQNADSWDRLYEFAKDFKFDTWPRDSKIVSEEKEIAKQGRDAVKKKFNMIRDSILVANSQQAIEEMQQMYPILVGLKDLVVEFSKVFLEKKKEKNSMDFNDIEHFALSLLVTVNEKGEKEPTPIAEKYRKQFVEIAIDEYQDSNLVQEYILNVISRGNNIFMVGDVKQSIYRFRQARPELFIQKYETYPLKEKKTSQDSLKIQLFKNFRSRQNILDITNFIFENIMTKSLGDIDYNEQEYLNLGANYEEPKEQTFCGGKAEWHLIDLKDSSEVEQEESQEFPKVEDCVLEARLVANQIQRLIESKYQVYDKKIGYRPVRYRDIAVLLRSTSFLAPIYEQECHMLGIPVFSDVGTQYLDTVEIQTMVSVLKIIDNPRQDIPLISVLRSAIGGFDDNELMEIKLEGKKEGQTCFYENIIEAKEKVSDSLKKKIEMFFVQLENWRQQEETLSLEELIWKIYTDTGYYYYVSLMPNGELRQANLKLLLKKAKQYENASFKGLFNFITFLDRLKSNNSDMDAAKLIGENEDVVSIMSIHKSKGLEFPVIILAGTAKKFNMQDLNEPILLHPELGIGPNYIHTENRVEYSTLAKEALRHQTKIETISEEMRILYVALTRAKEKLIITGLSKDVSKDFKQKQDLLDHYQTPKIPTTVLKKYKSYLDWLELVYLKHPDEMKRQIDLQIHNKSEFTKEITKQEIPISPVSELLEQKKSMSKHKVDFLLQWQYPNALASIIPTKMAVTQIQEKKRQITRLPNRDIQKTSKITTKPKFLQEELEITNAEKGTLIHLCIQKIKEKEEYTKEKLQQLIENMIVTQRITLKEAENIDISILEKYLKSDLVAELRQAKEIHKEQAFYWQLPAKEIYQKEVDANILVQGIIDLYYITQEDGIVLVDYKTDKIKKTEQELVEKYQEQLKMYQQALEEAFQKKVERVCIYSTQLAKTIELPL